MISHPSFRGTRPVFALIALASLAACGTLPADELGESYPVGEDPPAAEDTATPPMDLSWPESDRGQIVVPGACEQLACGGQSCTDGICNALSWRMQLEGAYDGELGGMAMTPEGDIVVAGSFIGEMNSPDGGVTSEDRDLFVAKLAWTGELMWLKRFGGEGSQRATSVAIGDKGQIAIGGELSGAMKAGELSLVSAGQEDGFVIMLDADGHPRWANVFGDAVADDGSVTFSEHQTVADVVVLPGGDVAVAGSFYGALRVAEEMHTATGQDGFVAYLRSDGVARWARALGGAGDTVPTAMAVDAQGNLVVTGAFSGELTLDGTVASSGGEDAFVASLHPGGAEIWLHSFGGSGTDRAEGLAVDDTGSVFVTGTFGDELSFDAAGVVIAGEGGGDGFVARFSGSDGGFDDARAFGDDMPQHPAAISVGPDGDAAVVGWFSGTLDFGLGPMTADEDDAFVAVFGKDDLLAAWSHRYGPGADQRARAAAHHDDGTLVFAGEFVRTIDVGWGPLSSYDLNRKIFVAAVAP